LSCHGTAQKIDKEKPDDKDATSMVPPMPKLNNKGEWKPVDDSETMKWYGFIASTDE
jgi:hypothetical protein